MTQIAASNMSCASPIDRLRCRERGTARVCVQQNKTAKRYACAHAHGVWEGGLPFLGEVVARAVAGRLGPLVHKVPTDSVQG